MIESLADILMVYFYILFKNILFFFFTKLCYLFWWGWAAKP